jgi:hypothetical protein
MENYIPVLDLFAGPGGLAEGTSAFIAPDGKKPFDITLSVEKENSAWRTLRLRAFTRQFKDELPQHTINTLLANWVIVLKMNCSKYIRHRPNKLITKHCSLYWVMIAI